GFKRGTVGRGAPVLPDDGAGNRFAARALPDHRRLALVGDAERGDVVNGSPRALDHLAHRGERIAPDVLGIVFHPAGRWVVLLEIAPRQRHRARLGVEEDRAARGGPLIDRQHVPRWAHEASLIENPVGIKWRPGAAWPIRARYCACSTRSWSKNFEAKVRRILEFVGLDFEMA